MFDIENQYIIDKMNPPVPEVLLWLKKQTHLRTNYGRMLSGEVQGRFLTSLVKISKAQRILEIGTFTGYSAICLALGLGENGHVDALEINDELEDLILEGWERAGLSEKLSLHIGDAKEKIIELKAQMQKEESYYDMVFIDANKREYLEYYNLVIDIVTPGGLIIVDDVLWDGKVYAEKIENDKQTQSIVKFNETIAQDSRVETLILPFRHGLNLIRKL